MLRPTQKAVRDVIRDLYSFRSHEDWLGRADAALRRVVKCDSSTLVWMDQLSGAADARIIGTPREAWQKLLGPFNELQKNNHPLPPHIIKKYGQKEVLCFSDFGWKDCQKIKSQVYDKIDIFDSARLVLDWSFRNFTTFNANLGPGRKFDPTHRLVLNELTGYFAAAFQLTKTDADIQTRAALAGWAGLAVVDGSGGLTFEEIGSAEFCLEQSFPGEWPRHNRLPVPLQDWLKEWHARLADRSKGPPEPYKKPTRCGRLIVDGKLEPGSARTVLLVQIDPDFDIATDADTLIVGRMRDFSHSVFKGGITIEGGLTTKQAEVMYHLAAYLKNEDIAGRIGKKTRTVDEHLSAIRAKLRRPVPAATRPPGVDPYGQSCHDMRKELVRIARELWERATRG